jgi:alkanesulfonate monooxygenase SsuD/methylene tetrahydromethanopterin reductase-like flavin-dependent oxidoreductase (luciferase family)
MDVGLMMIFASYGWENMSDDQVWDEDLRLARRAPALGFDALWSAEHHFFDYSSHSASGASLTTRRRRRCGYSPKRCCLS